MRFPLCTIMVKDKTDHGVPVAFIITSSGSSDVYTTVLDELRLHVGVDIQPKYILVDDAAAEISAIQRCEWGRLGAKVALCTWHVKRSWLKNLISKVKGKSAAVATQLRVELLKALGNIVSAEVRTDVHRPDGTQSSPISPISSSQPSPPDISHAQSIPLALAMQTAFVALCEKVSPAFLVYYKSEWEGKIDLWAHAYLPGVGAYTNGVIESYHGVIKMLFFTTKCVAQSLFCRSLSHLSVRTHTRRRTLVGKRLDWLIHVLYTRIFPYYSLKNARNTRQANQQALAAYAHDSLLPAALGRALPAAAPPLLLATAADAGAGAGALARTSAVAAAAALRQRTTLLGLFDTAKELVEQLLAGGTPPAALTSQATLMRTVVRSLQGVAESTAPAAATALVANPGDGRQVRCDPACFGGRSRGRSYKPRAPPPQAGARPTPLVANASTKKRKTTSVMHTLRRKG